MQKQYKKFINIFILTTVLFIASIMLFNFILDPAGLYRPRKYELGIAKILLQGKNVANIKDGDERLIEKYIIDNMNYVPSTIILGSSRSMQITPKGSFFNNGVSAASIEDLIAIYGMYNRKNIKPKTIIISLDPWILNKDYDSVKWQSIKEYFIEETLKLKVKLDNSKFDDINSKKIKELLSTTYLIASFNKFENILLKKYSDMYYATDKEILDCGVKKKNGTGSYPAFFRNKSLNEVNKKAREYVKEDMSGINNFDYLANQQLFEAFIDDMKSKNIKVVFFLPAYHPIVYSEISTNKKYKNVLLAEDYFYKFAKNNNIQIIGSYNPQKLHLSENDFYDATHLKQEAINRIFNRL